VLCVTENCTVDLAAFGFDDAPIKYGYIRTSGSSSLQIYVPESVEMYRGVNIVELDPTTCTAGDRQHFDPYGHADHWTQLMETLESATTGTIMVGVTADTPGTLENMGITDAVASFFTRYNMTLPEKIFRKKFAFIMQNGYPRKTIFQAKPRYRESLRMSVAIRGKL